MGKSIMICPLRGVECPLYQDPSISAEEKCPWGVVDKTLVGGAACAIKVMGIYDLRQIKESLLEEALKKAGRIT